MRGSNRNFDLLGGGSRNGLTKQQVEEVLAMLYPPDWKSAREPDEVAIILKDRMLELDLLSPMTCGEIDNLQIGGSMGSSAKKFVERLEEPELDSYSYHRERWDRKVMVVKSQANDVQTKIACMKQIYNAEFCNPMGNYHLMREVFFLTLFQHPSLINILGYCLRGDHISLDMRKKGMMLVMEAGTPLTSDVVSSLSWARRVALDVASLLEFLQTSPLGSLGLPRLQMKDFVLVNRKQLKLTDMDDVVLEDKQCRRSSDCLMQGSEVGVECQDGRCRGLNQRTNLWVFGRLVLVPLLQQSPPEERKAVDDMLDRIRRLDVSPNDLIIFLEELADKYEIREDDGIRDLPGYNALKNKRDQHLDVGNVHEEEDEDEDEDEEEDNLRDNVVETRRNKVRGDHPLEQEEDVKDRGELNPQPHKYKRMDSSNFPGLYDYTCGDSRVLWGCVMTFSSLSAAMDHCSDDSECRAFAVFSANPETESEF
nr:hypothetical protein BaRGS_025285 [Batillaria attramentaria]